MRVLCARRFESAFEDDRACAGQSQSAARDPGHRADHDRQAKQAVGSGRSRRPREYGRKGLLHCDSTQRAHFGSAKPRSSGAGLRSQMSRQPSVHQARRRTHPARTSAPGRLMTPPEEHRSRGLGRGLSALIGEEAAPTRGEAKSARTLPVAFLRPNRFQPRKTFAAEDLNDLTESVKEKGILQPILVRPVAGQADAFEIVAGERRWRAAQLAKLHDVPVVVREMSDSEALELAIVESVQRADLNAIEEGAAYHELMVRFQYSQDRIAKEVGKSRSHVANTQHQKKQHKNKKTKKHDEQQTTGHAR